MRFQSFNDYIIKVLRYLRIDVSGFQGMLALRFQNYEVFKF
jgi:hypothetical protein